MYNVKDKDGVTLILFLFVSTSHKKTKLYFSTSLSSLCLGMVKILLTAGRKAIARKRLKMDQPGQRQWLEYSTGNIHDGKNEKDRKKMFHRKWKNGLGLNMKTLTMYSFTDNNVSCCIKV